MVLGISSCAKKEATVTVEPAVEKWKVAEQFANAYEHAKNRGQRLDYAKRGIEYAKACIEEDPKNPACYYFRAINTGLYYKSKVVGYQKGLKAMVEDCTKVTTLDPKYDHAGGYRVLGMIYTEVPAFSLKADSVLRDLDKAVFYLLKAIEIAPDYPENYIALSNAYLKANDREEAALAIIKAKTALPEWKDHPQYHNWKKDIKKLSKKLKRQIKNLQLAKKINRS